MLVKHLAAAFCTEVETKGAIQEVNYSRTAFPDIRQGERRSHQRHFRLTSGCSWLPWVPTAAES